ncbi:fructose-bisphosphate aldolase [Alphaproteobacteria bacterium]|nr:fructose-bisphosphate aldolase [Alphaproteobacteria bacterium]
MTIQEIRERTLRARHLMARAQRQHFAVGAFNIDNQETLIAVSRAAATLDAPVIISVSQSEVDAMDLDNIRDMVDNYRVEYGVEMYVNLDHSPSVEAAKKGIDAGFEFIHIDISSANHNARPEEIIAGTREIVEYAKFTGAVVEAEPHYFAGSSTLHTEKIDYAAIKETFNTPEQARDFVAATGIDTFAASIGNLHGKYPVPKKLDLELLAEIRKVIDVNISLHGGSSTPTHYFTDAIKIGVQKININSDMRVVFRKTLEKVLVENPHEYAVVKLMPEVYVAVQKVVEAKIKAFGSDGKAVL